MGCTLNLMNLDQNYGTKFLSEAPDLLQENMRLLQRSAFASQLADCKGLPFWSSKGRGMMYNYGRKKIQKSRFFFYVKQRWNDPPNHN